MLQVFLLALPVVFSVVDPIGAVPIFLAVTARDSEAKVRETARRAALVSCALLAFFTVFGAAVFQMFGVTLPAFRVAGGLLLLLTAIDMLRAQPSPTRTSAAEQQEGAEQQDVAVVPLAIPVLAGPGAIATAMVLVMNRPPMPTIPSVLAAIAVTGVATYVLLASAYRVRRVLKATGIALLQRVMGLLLAAIAIQFIADGGRDLLRRTPVEQVALTSPATSARTRLVGPSLPVYERRMTPRAPNWFIGFSLQGNSWLESHVRAAPAQVRRYHPGDIHLTVAFLGQVSQAQAAAAWKALAWTAGTVNAKLGLVELMGQLPQASALSARVDEPTGRLAAEITQVRPVVYRAAGIDGDQREVRPHVTVARIARAATSEEQHAAVEWAHQLQLGEVEVSFGTLALFTASGVRGPQQYRIVERRSA